MIGALVTGIRTLYHKFPPKFWVVVSVHFIDKVGGTLVFPFFALYITRKFQVGMTEAGILLGVLSLSGIAGAMIGGGLTDRLGRRKLILFGLVFSAMSSLALGLVNDFRWLYPVAVLVGLLSDVGGPAHSAMIADILARSSARKASGFCASSATWRGSSARRSADSSRGRRSSRYSSSMRRSVAWSRHCFIS